MTVFDLSVAGNGLGVWVLAVTVAIGGYVVLRLLLQVAQRRLGALAQASRVQWDDIVARALGQTKPLFLAVLAVYAGTTFLTLPSRVRGAAQAAAVLALLLQSGLWLSAGLNLWLVRYTQRELQTDRSAATTISALGFVVKLVLWSIVLLVALDNLGVNISTLVAGLGVGGVAVALAVQNILGDLFASLSIVLDKPFVLGDFVIVDEYLGKVEHIGLKTTRLRSLWGEQVIFSNADLLKSRLRNFGRLLERRVVFEVGVTYQTPREKLERIPGIIREAIEQQAKTRFDRSHFKAFGPSALTFESVYYVLDPDYNRYMDVQQAVNLQIHGRFEAESIEFAYPTQTLFLVPQGAERGLA